MASIRWAKRTPIRWSLPEFQDLEKAVVITVCLILMIVLVFGVCLDELHSIYEEEIESRIGDEEDETIVMVDKEKGGNAERRVEPMTVVGARSRAEDF